MHAEAGSPTAAQTELISRLKTGALRNSGLPISTNVARPLGSLVAITPATLDHTPLLEAMCRWRQENSSGFLTVVSFSVEGTRRYIEQTCLPDHSRILFLVDENGGRHVGTVGLARLSADSVEISNVLRGEAVRDPSLMFYAQLALMGWAYDSLGVGLAYLNVLSSNRRATRAYQKLGFSEARRQKLSRQSIEGGYRLSTPSSGDGPFDDELITMDLSRADFYRVNSWLAPNMTEASSA